ncbi:MAG: hypothetical protein Roseis2KO_19880 [Roseivirga sp.]
MRHLKNIYCILFSILLISLITACQKDDEPGVLEFPQRFLEKTTNASGTITYASYSYDDGLIVQKMDNETTRSEYIYQASRRLSQAFHFLNPSLTEPWSITRYEYPGNPEIIRREEVEGRSVATYEYIRDVQREYLIRESVEEGVQGYLKYTYLEGERVTSTIVHTELTPGYFVTEVSQFSYDKPVRNPLFGLYGKSSFEERWLPTEVVTESTRDGLNWFSSTRTTYEYETDANDYPEREVMCYHTSNVEVTESTTLYHYYD